MPSPGCCYRICTALGDVVVELYPERAPATCCNFVAYASSGRFDHSSFYRVLGPRNQGEVACPLQIVQGGVRYYPAKGYQPELGLGPIRHESTAVTGLRHYDGTVTMGRFDPGETYGGFCICVGDQPELDFGGRRFPDGQGAAAFGRVLEGMDLIRRIQAGAIELEFPPDPVAITCVAAIPCASGDAQDHG